MTRVLIPAPAVEADVSAEQVEAYLLREGWVERDGHPGDVLVTFERSESGLCTWVPKDGHERDLARCIADIARAEGARLEAAAAAGRQAWEEMVPARTLLLQLVDTARGAGFTVADDGGSSGRLREEFDILPPGDLRMALAALCGDDEVGPYQSPMEDGMQHFHEFYRRIMGEHLR